jgi:hypothetical protein
MMVVGGTYEMTPTITTAMERRICCEYRFLRMKKDSTTVQAGINARTTFVGIRPLELGGWQR